MATSIHSRYRNLETLEVADKLSLASRPVPDSTGTSGAILHTVVGRETLDQLARKYYGREDLWWRIADANPTRFPLDWEAGDVLVIPSPARATRTTRS